LQPVYSSDVINQRLDASIKEFKQQVDEAMDNLTKTNNTQQRSSIHRIEISFSSTTSGFFGKEQEWEKWTIPFRIIPTNENSSSDFRSKKVSALVSAVEKTMKQILMRAQAKTDHLPPILDSYLTLDGCYPFKVGFNFFFFFSNKKNR
jgi:hypothetical protein